MLDLTKPVQTRDGRAVRILATDVADSDYPIVAATQYEPEDEIVETFTREGHLLLRPGVDTTSGNDLINVPEKRVLWLNIYDGSYPSHDTYEEAERSACSSRIACVRVEYEIGQFDKEPEA